MKPCRTPCTQHFFPGDTIQAVQGLFSALDLTFGVWGVKVPKQSRIEEGEARVHASGLLWVSHQIREVELLGHPPHSLCRPAKSRASCRDQTVLRVGWGAWSHIPAQASG